MKEDSFRRIHIIGIGGAGMSAIAIVFHDSGYEVSGSDLKHSRYVEFVSSRGIPVFIGHRPELVENKDLVIYSTAIPDNNPELKRARELGIRTIHRSEALALLTADKKLIAVTGSHGKTTTTSLVAHTLRTSGIDAGFIVGGEINDYGSNASSGKSDYFVLEADESDGTFLKLDPQYSIFTNLEPEHLDFFESEKAMIKAARKFIAKTTVKAFVCADDARLLKLSQGLEDKVIFYGFSAGDFRITEFETGSDGSQFKLLTPEGKELVFKLRLKGLHNIQNAAGVAALALNLGLSFQKISKAFASFSGVGRRLQLLTDSDGIFVFDDYAHHPTEILKVLQTLKKSGFKRIIAVFQPHRYSRTFHLLSDFPGAFKEADVIVTTEIYAAGEEPIPGITGKYLFEQIASANPQKHLAFIPRIIDLPQFMVELAKPGDAVVFMGAGDITLAAQETARLLRKNDETS
jgi:UDP-N-acetylmuramate--alanine ligase